MDHQDWNTITFNSNSAKNKTDKSTNKASSNKQKTTENIRIEAPKQLGQLILNARTACKKNQKELALLLGISPQILGRWEQNKEIPTNLQLSHIEKVLKVKLPRSKKVIIKEGE